MHYIGAIFDINNIEKRLQEAKIEYNEAKKDTAVEKIDLKIDFDGETIDWHKESIVFPFLPKKFIKSFTAKSGVFMSKMVPLLLVAETRSQDEAEEEEGGEKQSEIIKILFKYGDDLRQDNLVLQFFRIMDEMWMEKNLNMEMVLYKVLETGFEMGFIEFV